MRAPAAHGAARLELLRLSAPDQQREQRGHTCASQRDGQGQRNSISSRQCVSATRRSPAVLRGARAFSSVRLSVHVGSFFRLPKKSLTNADENREFFSFPFVAQHQE